MAQWRNCHKGARNMVYFAADRRAKTATIE